MFLNILTAAAAANGAPSAVKATGAIGTTTVANIVDGEYFSLTDGLGGAARFVFDKNASYADDGVGPMKMKVDLNGLTTADHVRDAIITAINDCAGVRITASSGGAATVTLTNDEPGPHGNTKISEQVANGAFTVTDFSSGAISGVASDLHTTTKYADHEDPVVLVDATADVSVLAAAIAVWGYEPVVQKWYRHKVLNAGSAIAETSADAINYSESVAGLRHFTRLYAEVLAAGLSGTNPVINVRLKARL